MLLSEYDNGHKELQSHIIQPLVDVCPVLKSGKNRGNCSKSGGKYGKNSFKIREKQF